MSKKLNSSKRKVFLENFFSLSVLQFFSYILPLLTIPYLTRALGLEGFGVYIFVQTIINFLDVFVSYGFRVSATDDIAKNRKNPSLVSKIFSEVICTKIVLALSVFLLLLIGTVLIPDLADIRNLIFLGLPLLIGNLLFPVWLFQGLQNMKFIAILHLIAKSFFVVTIFIFIQNPGDVGAAIFLHSMGFFISGVLSILVAFKIFDLEFHIPATKAIYNQLIAGRNIFLSQLMVAFYSSVNVIVLGIFHPGMPVAAYALGDKVYKLVGSLSAPFNRAVFPFLSAQYAEDKNQHADSARQSIILMFLVFSVLGGAVYFLAPWILVILAGKESLETEAVVILKILSVAIPFFVTAALTTYHLITQKKATILLKILVTAAACNMALVFPISYFYKSVGVAYLTLGIMIMLAIAQVLAVFHSSTRKRRL